MSDGIGNQGRSSPVRWWVAGGLLGSLALAFIAWRICKRDVVAVSEDGACVVLQGRHTGNWFVQRGSDEELIGAWGYLSKFWSEWWTPQHLVITDLDHRFAELGNVRGQGCGVVVEVRQLPDVRKVKWDDSHVISIYEYDDSRGTECAFITVPDRPKEYVVGEGAWRIDATWVAESKVVMSVEPRGAMSVPNSTTRVGGVEVVIRCLR